MPQVPPRNVNWFKKGKWVHLAKVAFENGVLEASGGYAAEGCAWFGST